MQLIKHQANADVDGYKLMGTKYRIYDTLILAAMILWWENEAQEIDKPWLYHFELFSVFFLALEQLEHFSAPLSIVWCEPLVSYFVTLPLLLVPRKFRDERENFIANSIVLVQVFFQF